MVIWSQQKHFDNFWWPLDWRLYYFHFIYFSCAMNLMPHRILRSLNSINFQVLCLKLGIKKVKRPWPGASTWRHSPIGSVDAILISGSLTRSGYSQNQTSSQQCLPLYQIKVHDETRNGDEFFSILNLMFRNS